jgi:hypothetical protein
MSNPQLDLDLSKLLRLPLTNGQKWLAALIAAVLFAIISSSVVYQLTNSLMTSVFGPKAATWGANGPTMFGLLLHSVVFLLVVRLLLW